MRSQSRLRSSPTVTNRVDRPRRASALARVNDGADDEGRSSTITVYLPPVAAESAPATGALINSCSCINAIPAILAVVKEEMQKAYLPMANASISLPRSRNHAGGMRAQ